MMRESPERPCPIDRARAVVAWAAGMSRGNPYRQIIEKMYRECGGHPHRDRAHAGPTATPPPTPRSDWSETARAINDISLRVGDAVKNAAGAYNIIAAIDALLEEGAMGDVYDLYDAVKDLDDDALASDGDELVRRLEGANIVVSTQVRRALDIQKLNRSFLGEDSFAIDDDDMESIASDRRDGPTAYLAEFPPLIGGLILSTERGALAAFAILDLVNDLVAWGHSEHLITLASLWCDGETSALRFMASVRPDLAPAWFTPNDFIDFKSIATRYQRQRSIPSRGAANVLRTYVESVANIPFVREVFASRSGDFHEVWTVVDAESMTYDNLKAIRRSQVVAASDEPSAIAEFHEVSNNRDIRDVLPDESISVYQRSN